MIINKIRALIQNKSEFNKNVFTLLTGTTISQLIPFLLSPILSRLYSVNDFGNLAVIVSVISPIVVLSTLRYELAIVLPKKNSEAINVVALSTIITFVISFLTFIVILVLFKLYDFETLKLIKNWFYVVPILVLLLGNYQILSNWANRNKEYKNIVAYRITNSIFNGGVSTFLGAIKFGGVGLLTGILLGNLFSHLVITFKSYKKLKEYWCYVSISEIKRVAIHYKVFPLTNSFQALSDSFLLSAPIYFLKYFFMSLQVGWYSYAIRILQTPMSFIGGAIAQVFYQQAAEKFNNKELLHGLVIGTIIKSSLIGLPILLVLLLFGPNLFQFVFGENWREAGVYAQILSPWLYLDFIRSPISQIPIIIGKQKRLLLISVISNFLLIFSMVCGGLIFKDSKVGFYLLSITESIYTLFIILWFYKISIYTNEVST